MSTQAVPNTSFFNSTPSVQQYLIPSKNDSVLKTALKITAFIPCILPLLIWDAAKAIHAYFKSEAPIQLPVEEPVAKEPTPLTEKVWGQIYEYKGTIALISSLSALTLIGYSLGNLSIR